MAFTFVANFLCFFSFLTIIYLYIVICTRYDAHEKEIGNIALAMGFNQVSLSSAVMPMVKIVPRGYTGRKYIICYLLNLQHIIPISVFNNIFQT